MSSSASGCRNSGPTRPVEDTTATESVVRYFLKEQRARGRHLARSLEDGRGIGVGEEDGRTAGRW